MMYRRVLTSLMNGRHTYLNKDGYDDAMPQGTQANHWSSTEYNSNNAWNVNFSSGNVNNNNKYNALTVRPCVASDSSTVPHYFLESVWTAFHDCKRGKMSSVQCVEYLSMAEQDIPKLAEEMWTNTYYPSTSTCFLVSYPKWREVFAANFRDRIVHHWVCIKLNPIFEQRFYDNGNVSFNCRVGFGTRKAVEHVAEGIKTVTNDYHKKAWIFKGDLVGFFMSIDKDIMWKLMNRFIRRKYHGVDKDILLRLVRIIIYHCPEKDCILNTEAVKWQNLQAKKSLHRCPQNRGMAIGNLTTQLFANFYMSYFDDYVRFVFRNSRYSYSRFVDDFVIVCDDHELLTNSRAKLEAFLNDVLHLRLHKNKHYFQEASHGVMFVGSYIKNGRTYLSNRTIARFREKVFGYSRLMKERELNTADVARIQCVVNSYLGFCKGHKTYKIRKSILQSFCPEFNIYFYIEGHYESIKVKNKFKPLSIVL